MNYEITNEQWEEWHNPNRRHIQDIFPNLSPCEREHIKMGTTAQEWAEMFGGCYMKKQCVYYLKDKKCKYNIKLKR